VSCQRLARRSLPLRRRGMVGRSSGADRWTAGGAGGSTAFLTLGFGHRPFADPRVKPGDFAWHAQLRTVTSRNPDVAKSRLGHARCLNRQLSLPVSTMSQWWVSRSSRAAVILASPNTLGHSPNAKFVVMITEVRS